MMALLALVLALALPLVLGATVPGVPTGVVCQSGPNLGGMVLSFYPPTGSAGEATLFYTVRYAIGSAAKTYVYSTSSPVQLTGLTAGSSYSFEVAAVNVIGTGSYSTSVVCIAGAIATVPTGVTISYNASLSPTETVVSWTPPSSFGGMQSLSYRIQVNDTSDTVVQSVVVATLNTLTFYSMASGTYRIKMNAYSSIGESPYTDVETFTLGVQTVPTAPRLIQWTAISGGVQVFFDPPVSDGGSPLLSYTLTADSTSTVTGYASPLQLTGLTAGSFPVLALVATNAIGSSVALSTSTLSPITGFVPPVAPTGVVVTLSTDSSVNIDWTHPDIGTSRLSGFIVSYGQRGNSKVAIGTNSVTTSSSAHPITISNLCPSTVSYYVEAVGSAADYGGFTSSASAAVSFTSAGLAAGVATSVQVVTTASSIKIFFGPPATGSAVTTYRVDYIVSFTTVTKVGVSPITLTDSLSANIANTYSLTPYSCVLAASTAVTFSATPVAMVVTPAPTSVTILTVTAGSTFLTLTFNITSLASTNYVSFYNAATDVIMAYVTFNSASVPNAINLTSLTNGQTYSIYAVARSIGGETAISTAVTGLPFGPVGPVRNLACISGPALATITCSWAPPADTGGLSLASTAYTWIYSSTVATGGSGSSGSTTLSFVQTSLVAGTYYTVNVTAQTAKSVSIAQSVTVRAAALPTNPSITCTDTANSISIAITAPTDFGGEYLKYYLVTDTASSVVTTHNLSTATTATFTGLTNGEAHLYSVQAYNDAGASAAATVSCTASTVPDCPPNVMAIAGTTLPGQATTNWSLVTNNGGAVVTGYSVSWIGATTGGPVAISGINTLIWAQSSLTQLGSYQFMVVATNRQGSTASCPYVSVIASGKPDAPVLVSVVPSDSALTLTVTASTGSNPSGGVGLAQFNCTLTATSFTSVAVHLYADSTPFVVSSLTNGVTYSVTCVAINTVGSVSVASSPKTGVPAAIPNQVRNVTLTSGVGAGGILVVWIAPSATNGAAITGYLVSWINQATPALTGSLSLGVVLTYQLTGLVRNQTYNVSVQAINSQGYSTIGTTSSAIGLAAAPPCPVSDVVITPGDTTLAVTWVAPTCTGGLPVTSYTLRIVNNATGVSTTYSQASPLSYTFTGLVNGQWYYIGIVAVNTAGSSTEMPLSGLSKPSTLPSAPVLTGTSPGDGLLTLALSAPTSNGGLTITDYDCFYADSTLGTSSISLSFLPTDAFVITGLTNSHNYSIVCVCSNANGASPLSATVYGIPADVPGPPTDLVLVSGPLLGQINASWLAPTSNGGLPVASYNVTWSGTTKSGSVVYTPTQLGSAYYLVLTSLTPNLTYFVTVQSINQVGLSPVIVGTGYSHTGYQLAANVPCTPYLPVYTRGSQSLVATWATSLCNGGMTIQYYFLYVQLIQTADGTTVTNGVRVVYQVSASAAHTMTAFNLTNGAVYSAQMSAANVIGNSTLSTLVSFVPATVPSAPTSLTCKSGPTTLGAITVNWAQPDSLGGLLTTTKYQFTYTRLDTLAQTTQDCTGFQCTDTALVAHKNYSVTAVAFNDVGAGAATSPVYCTAGAVPDAIAAVACVGTDQTMTLIFSVPWSNVVLQSYSVNYTVVGGASVVKTFSPSSATTMTIQLTSVSNELQYSIFVTSCNSIGCSTASPTFSCAAGTPPNVPTSVVAKPYNTEIVVTYGLPAAPTGSAVTLYKALIVQTGVMVSSATLSLTFTGLTTLTAYTVLLWASNDYGVSANVTVSTTTLQLMPPSNNQAYEPADATTPTCQAWFTPYPQLTGSPSTATTFVVSYRLFGSSDAWVEVSTPAATIPASITGLQSTQSYSLRVRAENSYAAASAESTEFVCVLGQSNYVNQAGAPTILAGPGSNQSVVAITTPSNTGGSPAAAITRYLVYSSSTTAGVNGVSTTAYTDATFFTASGLLNGYVYYHYVIADNGIAQQQYVLVSQPSAVVSTAPLATYKVPSAVTQDTLVMTPGNLRVSFRVLTAPTSNSPILGYLVMWPVVTAGVAITSGSRMSNSTAIIVATGNLINGVSTLFQFQAVNGAGLSAYLFTTAVVPGTLPGPPINVIGSPRNLGADVFFQAPLDSGSNTVTSYNIYFRDLASSVSPTSGASAPISVTGLNNSVVSNLTICSVSSVSPTGVPLWLSAAVSCYDFTVIANPFTFPNLNGSLIFAEPVATLPTSGVRGLDNICLSVLPYSHALVCDSASDRSITNSFWYRPTDQPVYVFNAARRPSADYTPISPSPSVLVSGGLRVDTGFSTNFTTFFDHTAPIGVADQTALTADLASAPAFTGCQVDGTADSTGQCAAWTLGSGSSLAIATGKTNGLSTAADRLTNWFDDGIGGTCGDSNKYLYCVWFPSAEDGIQNGDEIGVDCGGTTRFYNGESSYPCVVSVPTVTCPTSVNLATSLGLSTAVLVLPNVTVVSSIRYTLSYTYVSSASEASNGDVLDISLSPWSIQAKIIDGKSQQANCTFPVVILDKEAPHITCPATVSTITNSGVSYATSVTWTTPTGGDISDNVGVVSVAPLPVSTTQWPVGDNTVTLFASDAAGNKGNCTFHIIVVDQEPPTITYCPTDLVQSTDAGHDYATLAYPSPRATDNVGLRVANGTVISGYALGTRVYVSHVTGLASVSMRVQFQDLQGNVNDCAFIYTIRDTEKPQVTCPADVYTVTDTNTSTRVLQLKSGTVTDNVNLTSSSVAPQFAVGVSLVEMSAMDEIGNTNTCSYKVNVADVEAPVLVCPSAISVTLASGIYLAPVVWSLPTMTDNVGVVSYTSTASSGDSFPMVTLATVTYTARDAANNTGNCSFTVTVLGSINTPQPASGFSDPSIQCPSDVVRATEYATSPGSATVYWSAPSVVNSKTVVSVSGNALTLNNTVFLVGTTYLTYNLVDSAGSTATCSFRVTITELTTSPTGSPSRAQVSVNAITTDLLALQQTLLTSIASALGISVMRVSVVVVVAGYSSTDVVIEFSQSPSTYYALNPTSRRLLAAPTEAQDMLTLFKSELMTTGSALLLSDAGPYLVPSTFVNCSSDTTPTGVTRAIHCPLPTATSCATGCTLTSLCYTTTTTTSSSVPWHKSVWFVTIIQLLCWLLLLLLLFCCGFLTFVVDRDRKGVVSKTLEPATVPWPEVQTLRPRQKLIETDFRTHEDVYLETNQY